MISMEKEYEGIFRIGAVTKTYDTETEEENISPTNHITEEMLLSTAKTFIGETEQIPPMYSAVKYKGKPLYSHARKRKIYRIKNREKIFISKFEVKKNF